MGVKFRTKAGRDACVASLKEPPTVVPSAPPRQGITKGAVAGKGEVPSVPPPPKRQTGGAHPVSDAPPRPMPSTGPEQGPGQATPSGMSTTALLTAALGPKWLVIIPGIFQPIAYGPFSSYADAVGWRIVSGWRACQFDIVQITPPPKAYT